jgi:hypothetical protein
MTKQEFLTKIFEANKARELDYTAILNIVMAAKKTTDPANVDQVSLINTLQSLTEQGIVISYTLRKKPHVDAFEWIDTPFWTMVG